MEREAAQATEAPSVQLVAGTDGEALKWLGPVHGQDGKAKRRNRTGNCQV